MTATAQTLSPPSRTLMFLEGRAIHEFGAFLGALPLLSLAPRGDGHPVLVLPGLVASDGSTRALRTFLSGKGYAVSGWRQGRNYGLREGVQHAMVDLVQELSDRHGRKISLVGWSLGGLYARQLAKMMPDRVRQVITLGSPFAGDPHSTNAWRVYEWASGRKSDEVDPQFGGDLAVPPPVPTTAIFSRTDGVCAWQGCMEKSGAQTESIEIESSHCGMGHHPAAVFAVADRLAQKEGQLAALRPQRLAQRGLSRSASVVLCLSRKNGEREKRDRRTRPLSRPHQTRYASRMAHPLSRIIEQLKREPSRTGSIVITVFGDAIVPRGGSVWLGTLLEFFESLDIDSGVVRTAMSRLAADGWLTREKVGRNSFYRLADKGRQIFEAATRHIYDPPPSGWTGRFELLLIGNGEDRDASREALRNAGFGSPLPGVWVAPSGVPVPDEAAGAIRLEVSAEDDSGRRLLSASWPLDRTADAYLKFMKTFEPLRAAIARGTGLSEADAFTARILLIHHYRRVVLRDPLLPESLLPANWPGKAARALCGDIYRALLVPSEQWLDGNGTNEKGPLPPARKLLERRFEA